MEIIGKIESISQGFLGKYVIGCNNTKGETFQHEICHAKYYLDKEYKKEKDDLLKKIKKSHYNIFKKNLLSIGYPIKVMNDEIQAYLQYGYEMDCFGKGVSLKDRKKYNKMFQQ